MRIASRVAFALSIGFAVLALVLWRRPQARRSFQRSAEDLRGRVQTSTVPENVRQGVQEFGAGLRAQVAAKLPTADATDAGASTPMSDIGRALRASLAPKPGDEPGVLEDMGDDLTVTQRVLSSMGHQEEFQGWPHLNINTEGDGVVHLRGYVRDEPQRQLAELVASQTEGVKQVVNHLEIENEISG